MHSLKNIVIGVTGCVAAYKTAHLIRLLVQAGVNVRVVMTHSAAHFVGEATFQALSGHPVYSSLWDTRIDNQMAHIELARWADLILIAPATADIMAKLAHGQSDSLLTTLCLARHADLWIAPAMNQHMWNHPATQRNAQQLQADGISLLGPAKGLQACGDDGDGRMIEPETIFSALQGFGVPQVLKGKKVIVTAGPTFEALDTVRGLTNKSSGKMGFAIAEAAIYAGAQNVILVSGSSVSLPTPIGVQRINTVSAQEMFDAVHQHLDHTDFFFSVAAVSDYKSATTLTHKVKRENNKEMTTQWVANPDILASVVQSPNPPFCIGFAAESESLIHNAEQKRQRKGVPLLAANWIHEAVQNDTNTLILIDADGIHPLPSSSKTNLARQLVLYAAQLEQKLHNTTDSIS
ncbi:MAG: bifunctional phosphopantothenoylcysteine decarboxylase/phosphopantothenate--cysteine ligase CoaBC [Pseudomonadota bacterium]